uniref:Uncharacterized protein n=1 Tax=Picea glauca TaxID=3330 RepID=A0A101LTT7_PICGL|nr:hypothetical protein ABT39_MTgene3548 [Picea glauca]
MNKSIWIIRNIGLFIPIIFIPITIYHDLALYQDLALYSMDMIWMGLYL